MGMCCIAFLHPHQVAMLDKLKNYVTAFLVELFTLIVTYLFT